MMKSLYATQSSPESWRTTCSLFLVHLQQLSCLRTFFDPKGSRFRATALWVSWNSLVDVMAIATWEGSAVISGNFCPPSGLGWLSLGLKTVRPCSAPETRCLEFGVPLHGSVVNILRSRQRGGPRIAASGTHETSLGVLVLDGELLSDPHNSRSWLTPAVLWPRQTPAAMPRA